MIQDSSPRKVSTMSLIRRHVLLLFVSACSVAAGVGVSSIASAGAASPAKAASAHRSAHRTAAKLRIRELRRLAVGDAVEGDAVIHTKAGFVTVSFERGVVGSVSGQQLTMTESTRKASYKTVTLTIPSDAVIRDDRKVSSMTSLTAGQRVLVLTGPKRTLVVARTPKG
jgi:hypothetical protein